MKVKPLNTFNKVETLTLQKYSNDLKTDEKLLYKHELLGNVKTLINDKEIFIQSLIVLKFCFSIDGQ